jgi:hypothetical protein
MGNDPSFGTTSIVLSIGILLRPPPNLLMSRLDPPGIEDREKPAMTESWARKLALELHRCPQQQEHLR